MRYQEVHLSYKDQVQRLLNCGLEADRSELELRLKDVGYYRLSAYLTPFREYDEQGNMREKLTDGVTLRKVWNHYLFDRQLRLLFMDAIERIEVSLRVKISYLHTKNHEPFDYAEKTYFPHWKGYIKKLEDSKIKLKDDVIQGKQPYEPTGIEGVDSFFITYGAEHDCLPLWLAVGMIDYGTLIYFFRLN